MSYSALDVVGQASADSSVEIMQAILTMHYTKTTFAPKVTESKLDPTDYTIPGKQFGLWQWLVTWLIPMITQTILIMRVYALYMSNKKILGILSILFLACASVDVWLLATNIPRVKIIEIGGGVFCAPNLKTPHEFYRFWIPPLLFEALLCGMVAYIAIREKLSPISMLSPTRKQSIMSIMIRDSVFYFWALLTSMLVYSIAATYLMCLVWWRFSSIYLDAPIPFATAISSVLANRILINIRAAAMKDTDNLQVWRNTNGYR
ncbi:hypothetical protein CVT25_013074 [Psilocybe cyanescens]|uniref:Uncharacterized protein n=1 Tax=Psilocybe cyanescens TaxID=93625 RepID=A0A409XWR1_PSICY|nr:hypothetical protein CVT25_013074 [Psilocybe cyanescens]